MTTTTFDVLKLLTDARDASDGEPHTRDTLNDILLTLKRRFEDGYFGDLYRTDYVVEGAGEFPFDMLRYTCSWPRGENDSFAMAEEQRRRVTLSKYHRDEKPVLAEDRWLSKFRWRVVEVIETVAT